MHNRTKSIFAVLIGTFALAGCGGGAASTAESFATHLAAGEIGKAKELSTEPTAELLDLASSFGGLDIDPDFEFELIEESVDGNRAKITYRNKADGKVDTIDLVKLDGKWKVHAEKD